MPSGDLGSSPGPPGSGYPGDPGGTPECNSLWDWEGPADLRAIRRSQRFREIAGTPKHQIFWEMETRWMSRSFIAWGSWKSTLFHDLLGYPGEGDHSSNKNNDILKWKWKHCECHTFVFVIIWRTYMFPISLVLLPHTWGIAAHPSLIRVLYVLITCFF